MSFGTRLFLGAVALLLITVVTLTIAADRVLRHDFEASMAQELEREARLVAAAVPRGERSLNALAHRFGAALGRRVTLIDREGAVLGDSDFDDASLPLLENHRARPEVIAALAGRTAIDSRLSASTNRPELKVAIPAWPGVVRVSTPLEQVDGLVRSAQQTVLLGALVTLLFGLVAAGVAGRAMGRPLVQLSQAARALAAGEPPEFPDSGIPEIRQLTRTLRSSGEELRVHIERLHRGRQETETLVEAMPEGVLAVDRLGRVISCNTAMRRLLSYDPGVALPGARELFHQRDAREIVERALSGEAVVDEEADVNGRTVLFTARPLPDGGTVLVVHDISELKRLQAVRRDFVANVSHELRTPLTSIAGYAETLRSESSDPEIRQRFLDVILDNARRMQHLVDDLLDLARIESGRWRPAPAALELGAAVPDAWSGLAARADERNVGLEIEPAVPVYADPEALRQILVNLFDNAIRHTPAGGVITVSAQRADGGAEVLVRDTGSGIPSDHLQRVFERFYRVDPSRSRQAGGTGLGLSIVRHLVEAHGGRAVIESTWGEGTTVRLFFPDPSATA